MACSSCKKKQEREQLLKEYEKVERGVKIIILMVVLLSVYGLYSLVTALI